MTQKHTKRPPYNEGTPVGPPDEQTHRVAPLHGSDRSGLGRDGWAEVADDLIGGHPELDTVPDGDGPNGAINGPQPKMSPKTGAVEGA